MTSDLTGADDLCCVIMCVLCVQHPFVSSVNTNRPLRELVAEAKAEVREEIENENEEGEDDDAADLSTVRFDSLAHLKLDCDDDDDEHTGP